MSGLQAILSSPFLLSGLLWGLAGFAIGLGLRATLRVQAGREVPLLGVLTIGATLAAFWTGGRPAPTELWIGLLLLAVAALPLARRMPPLVALLPGAAIVALALEPVGQLWLLYLVLAAAPLTTLLVADFERRYRSGGLPPLLLMLSVLGVCFTTPDTEEALALAGAIVVVAGLGWPLRMLTLGKVGVYSVMGLFTWTVVMAGRGRDGAVVGGLAALGLLLIEPIEHRVGRSLAWSTAAPWALVALHAATVALAARVAGLQDSARGALWRALVILASAGALLALASRQEINAPRSEPPTPSTSSEPGPRAP